MDNSIFEIKEFDSFIDETIEIRITRRHRKNPIFETIKRFFVYKPNWIEKFLGVTKENKLIKCRNKTKRYIKTLENNDK